jgi:hypothetical protein
MEAVSNTGLFHSVEDSNLEAFDLEKGVLISVN